MAMIQNPVLRGFCPDPSIIRVSTDYYIATSTFEWWPGVRLFHSTDLANWEQLPSPIQRVSQADLRGDPTSGGIWAPCLTYDGSWFYLVYTDVKTKKGRFYNTPNYVIRTKDIRGVWSEPVYLNSIGFDPSLFHDNDGKKYLVNMINGFKGILVQEYDPEAGKLIGERKKIFEGTRFGYTEGPHIYHIGDWYYLIVAEGGTGYDHCVTMARSKSVWGPFEVDPNNPVLTSDSSDPLALQKCGHADIVDTPNGEWYMAHLCARPNETVGGCLLGRETALQKMDWQDGWLRLVGGGNKAKKSVPLPAGALTKQAAGHAFRDDFDGRRLSVKYDNPRIPASGFASLQARPGWLRLIGQESLNSLHNVSLIALRQQELNATASTIMEFEPAYPEQMAGLAYVYDAFNFYLLAKTVSEDGQPVLVLLKSDGGIITDLVEPVPVPEGKLGLRAASSECGTVQFSWKHEGSGWQYVGDAQPLALLTDEHCRGFTGAQFGMYVHDMTGLQTYADFDSFEVI